MNVSFIVHFYLGKYSFSFDTFFITFCILKKMNVSFIVHFYLGKYSFSFDTFFITFCILKKMNVSFIVHFYLGKYSFSFDTFFITSCILKKMNVSFIVHFYLFDNFLLHLVLSFVGNRIYDLSSNPGSGCFCFTLHSHNLGKGMNPSLPLPAIVWKTGFFSLRTITSLRERTL